MVVLCGVRGAWELVVVLGKVCGAWVGLWDGFRCVCVVFAVCEGKVPRAVEGAFGRCQGGFCCQTTTGIVLRAVCAVALHLRRRMSPCACLHLPYCDVSPR